MLNFINIKRFCITVLLLLFYCNLHGQQDQVVKSVQLDEVVIKASNEGRFDKEDFIKKVREDSSFYQAFKNLRMYNYSYKGKLVVKDKNGGDKAELERVAKQHIKNGWRWIEIVEEKKKGRLQHRDGEFRYFTAAMFHYVFFPEDTAKVETAGEETMGNNMQQRFYQKLKYLMFNPGSKVEGVPFVGHRLAVFEEGLRPYYDFLVSYGNCPSGGDCYIFTSRVKDAAEEESKPVIRELVSYFDIESGRIMHRSYKMNLTSLLYDFDVMMEVNLKLFNNTTVPTSVRYSGWWNIPFKKAEYVDFELEFYDYSDPVSN